MIKTIKEMFGIKREQLQLETAQTEILFAILDELVKLNKNKIEVITM